MARTHFSSKTPLDDTAGGADGETTKAPTSNALFDVNAVVLEHSARHESGGADVLDITHDMMEVPFLPYYLLRKTGRALWVQFETYDMVSSAVGGTGSVGQAYLAPTVTGAALNDTAVQYHNSGLIALGYSASGTIVFDKHLLSSATRDCEAFIGIAEVDNTVILSTTNNKKYMGFLFQVSGGAGKIWAVNCDGGGTAEDITATDTGETDVTANTKYLTLVWDGTDLKFYRYTSGNFTLVATHTTNIAALSTYGWKISIKQLGANAVTFNGRPFSFARS